MNAVLNRLEAANITIARKASPQRIEKKYIDEEVLKEAIINAFAHNDYSQGFTPIFEIYDDRFEITTYGDLLAWMDKEDFFIGTSKPRNPELVEIFHTLHYVEELGSGIPKIIKIYGREAFCFSNSITRLSLKFDMSVASIEKSGVKSGVKSWSKILDALRKNPKITTTELAEITGIGLSAVDNNLKKLKTDGKIERIGPKNGGYWKVIEPTH
ncbi:hypothetical protein AGMMS49941_04310 [Deferribacterales bacterium]|nr:hypothetical protein AGMMS49941_04310 [Deferribacterales bacterium]